MPAFPPATEDFSHLKANEGILNFKTASPTSVYVFTIVSCSLWADCIYASFMTILRVLAEPVCHLQLFCQCRAEENGGRKDEIAELLLQKNNKNNTKNTTLKMTSLGKLLGSG